MLVFYVCPLCGNSVQKVFSNPSSAPVSLGCAECGGWLERKITAPTSSTFETVDDGISHKKLEIRSDINTRRYEKGNKYLEEIKTRERPFLNKKEED